MADIKVCSNCGVTLKVGQLFCPMCGQKVEAAETPEVVETSVNDVTPTVEDGADTNVQPPEETPAQEVQPPEETPAKEQPSQYQPLEKEEQPLESETPIQEQPVQSEIPVQEQQPPFYQDSGSDFEPEPPKSKKKLIIIIVAAIAAAALIIIGIIVGMKMAKNNKYIEAKSLYDQGKYTEAIEKFTELGGYKDSAEMITECHYSEAESLEKKGSLEEALNIYTSLGSYKDSADRAKDLNNKVCYDKVLEYIHQGNGKDAIAQLDKISDYSEAQMLKKMAKSTIDKVSDEAYLIGSYIISSIDTVSFKSDMGGKMADTMQKAVGSNVKDLKTTEIGNALYKEPYITETVDWIKSIPDNGGDDSTFKSFVMDYYKLTMDSLYGQYVEKTDGFICSNNYALAAYYLMSNQLKLEDDTIVAYLKLDSYPQQAASLVMKGDGSLETACNVSDVLAKITVFGDVDD